MNKSKSVVLGILGGVVIFALTAAVESAILASLAHSSWNSSAASLVTLTTTFFIIKYGLAIFGGRKIYKVCMKRVPKL